MAYFSRLTDIVTCNLTSLLARNNNCAEFLGGIIREMQEGVAGAQRCAGTANSNVARLEAEIGEQRIAVREWISRAQESLKHSDEQQARLALERKHEVEDLIAGLEQQLQSAISTRDHLETMLHALQARLADAQRRLAELQTMGDCDKSAAPSNASATLVNKCELRQGRVEHELEELRKQLNLG